MTKIGLQTDADVNSHQSASQGRLVEKINSLEKKLQEQQQTIAQLREDIALNKIIFEKSRDGIVVLNLDGSIYDANQRFADMLGYDLESLLYCRIWDWDAVYSKEELLSILSQYKVPPAGCFETRHRRKDGSIYDVEISSHGTMIDGVPLVFCACRDVTERKQTERLLVEERSFLKTLIRTLPDMIWLKDPEGRFLFCNPSYEKLIGVKEAAILGKTDYDFLPRSLSDEIREKDLRVLSSARTCVMTEEITYAGDGHKELFETSKTPMFGSKGQLIGVLGIARNITAFQKTEKALRESRANLINTQRMARIGNYVFDLKDRTWTSSEILDDILGLSPATQRQVDQWLQLVHPDDRPQIEAFFSGQIPYRHRIFDKEFRIIRQDNHEVRWVLGMGRVEMDVEGRPIHLVGAVQDITELKQTTLELQNLVEAVDQASEGIFVTEVEGIIRYTNPAVTKISGYPKEDIIGRNIRFFFDKETDGIFAKPVITSILHGQRWVGRILFERKNGVHITAEVSISPMKNKQGRVVNFVGIIRDVSKEIKIEERLSQAQKMEAIGTLAGGIAHDFNNILSPLLGYAELLKMDLSDYPQQKAYVLQILNAAERAKNLVMQILTFSRQSDKELTPVKLQPIVKEALKLLRSSIPSTIEIVCHIDDACGPVIADATQIHQIVMNLATNAYHSMEEKGGRLTVDLTHVEMDEAMAQQADLMPGHFACLSVLDTGSGIEKTILEKIFDPYFTTKKKDKGTGLGLSVVQGIVKGSNGHIQVASEPGVGTQFQVYLPIISLNQDHPDVGRTQVLVGGIEKILLVDDEEMIALVLQQLLERLGYKVSIRVSSLEALAAFKAAPDKFDLIITDMTMPQMTGDVLAAEIKKIRPSIPVIMCTGFSERISSEDLQEIGIEGLLMKPVDATLLSQTVRRALDKLRVGDYRS